MYFSPAASAAAASAAIRGAAGAVVWLCPSRVFDGFLSSFDEVQIHCWQSCCPCCCERSCSCGYMRCFSSCHSCSVSVDDASAAVATGRRPPGAAVAASIFAAAVSDTTTTTTTSSAAAAAADIVAAVRAAVVSADDIAAGGVAAFSADTAAARAAARAAVAACIEAAFCEQQQQQQASAVEHFIEEEEVAAASTRRPASAAEAHPTTAAADLLAHSAPGAHSTAAAHTAAAHAAAADSAAAAADSATTASGGRLQAAEALHVLLALSDFIAAALSCAAAVAADKAAVAQEDAAASTTAEEGKEDEGATAGRRTEAAAVLTSRKMMRAAAAPVSAAGFEDIAASVAAASPSQLRWPFSDLLACSSAAYFFRIHPSSSPSCFYGVPCTVSCSQYKRGLQQIAAAHAHTGGNALSFATEDKRHAAVMASPRLHAGTAVSPSPLPSDPDSLALAVAIGHAAAAASPSAASRCPAATIVPVVAAAVAAVAAVEENNAACRVIIFCCCGVPATTAHRQQVPSGHALAEEGAAAHPVPHERPGSRPAADVSSFAAAAAARRSSVDCCFAAAIICLAETARYDATYPPTATGLSAAAAARQRAHFKAPSNTSTTAFVAAVAPEESSRGAAENAAAALAKAWGPKSAGAADVSCLAIVRALLAAASAASTGRQSTSADAAGSPSETFPAAANRVTCAAAAAPTSDVLPVDASQTASAAVAVVASAAAAAAFMTSAAGTTVIPFAAAAATVLPFAVATVFPTAASALTCADAAVASAAVTGAAVSAAAADVRTAAGGGVAVGVSEFGCTCIVLSLTPHARISASLCGGSNNSMWGYCPLQTCCSRNSCYCSSSSTSRFSRSNQTRRSADSSKDAATTAVCWSLPDRRSELSSSSTSIRTRSSGREGVSSCRNVRARYDTSSNSSSTVGGLSSLAHHISENSSIHFCHMRSRRNFCSKRCCWIHAAATMSLRLCDNDGTRAACSSMHCRDVGLFVKDTKRTSNSSCSFTFILRNCSSNSTRQCVSSDCRSSSSSDKRSSRDNSFVMPSSSNSNSCTSSNNKAGSVISCNGALLESRLRCGRAKQQRSSKNCGPWRRAQHRSSISSCDNPSRACELWGSAIKRDVAQGENSSSKRNSSLQTRRSTTWRGISSWFALLPLLIIVATECLSCCATHATMPLRVAPSAASSPAAVTGYAAAATMTVAAVATGLSHLRVAGAVAGVFSPLAAAALQLPPPSSLARLLFSPVHDISVPSSAGVGKARGTPAGGRRRERAAAAARGGDETKSSRRASPYMTEEERDAAATVLIWVKHQHRDYNRGNASNRETQLQQHSGFLSSPAVAALDSEHVSVNAPQTAAARSAVWAADQSSSGNNINNKSNRKKRSAQVVLHAATAGRSSDAATTSRGRDFFAPLPASESSGVAAAAAAPARAVISSGTAAATAVDTGLPPPAATELMQTRSGQQQQHGHQTLLWGKQQQTACIRLPEGSGCRLVAVGSAVPAGCLTNDDLQQFVETSDEWIRTRTGIQQRHVLLEHESLRELAVLAARRAVQHHQQQSRSRTAPIDLVLHASSTPDDLFGDATSVAAALTLPFDETAAAKGAATRDVSAAAKACKTGSATVHQEVCPAAFDISAACSGFLVGLITANALLSGSHSPYERALLVGADALSRWIDWSDRNTCVLFGDAAGAVLLERQQLQQKPQQQKPEDEREEKTAADAEKQQQGRVDNDHSAKKTRSEEERNQEQQQKEGKPFGLLSYVLNSDGLRASELTVPFTGKSHAIKRAAGNAPLLLRSGAYGFLQMNGREVFKFVSKSVPAAVEEVVAAAGLRVSDIDWLLLHQANKRIMDAVAQRLLLPSHKVLCNLEKYGNTSAASIPLCLDEAVREGKVKHGDVIVMAGFGAGLTWSAAVLRYG